MNRDSKRLNSQREESQVVQSCSEQGHIVTERRRKRVRINRRQVSVNDRARLSYIEKAERPGQSRPVQSNSIPEPSKYMTSCTPSRSSKSGKLARGIVRYLLVEEIEGQGRLWRERNGASNCIRFELRLKYGRTHLATI